MIDRDTFSSILEENVILQRQIHLLTQLIANTVSKCEKIATQELEKNQGRITPTLLRARSEQAALLLVERRILQERPG